MERPEYRGQVLAGGRLGHGDLHGIVAVRPEVHPTFARIEHDLAGPARDANPHRVEEVLMLDLETAGLERRGQPGSLAMHPFGDPLQSVRTVVDGVHRRHDGQQHLCCADVGGGLLPADVLLAGLQRQPECRGAVRIVRHPDQPARELTLHVGPHRDEAGMRPAETQWDTEPLRRPDGDVGPDLTRRAEQGQREQVGGHSDLGLPLVSGLDQLPVVTKRT